MPRGQLHGWWREQGGSNLTSPKSSTKLFILSLLRHPSFFKCCSSMPKAWLAGDGWYFPAESFCHLTSIVPVPHACCAPVPAKEHPVLSSAVQTQAARSALPNQASHHICEGHLDPPIQICNPQTTAWPYRPPWQTDSKASWAPPLSKPEAQTQSL